jgi:uncharacterized protein YbjT (DUF2867 family)
MNIALIGATGNVGTPLISELRRRGHQVTAIARHPEKLDRQDGVNPAVGDVQPRRRKCHGCLSSEEREVWRSRPDSPL